MRMRATLGKAVTALKKRLLALLLVIVCLCLSSCTMLTDNVLSIVADKANETGAEALARQFLDGLLEDDPQKSHAVFMDDVEMAQVLALFPQMQAALPDTISYTLTPVHWSTNTSDGVTMHAFQFQLTMAEETFVVETLQMSGVEGLYNLNIAPYTPEEAATSSVSGKISAVEVAFQLISLAAIILVIWALVDCFRHKFKRRWMWVLLIFLGNVLFSFALLDGRMSFNFRIGIYFTSNYLSMGENGFAMQWMLPFGALVYMLRRKHLIQPLTNGFAEAFASPETEASATEELDSTK